MDISIILEYKKLNLIKHTRKTIEKLFLLHAQKRIVNMNAKLDRLKDLINKNINEIQEIERQIKERKNEDIVLFYIVEFLNVNKCYKTSAQLCKKFGVSSDINFFNQVDCLVQSVHNNDYRPVLEFIKTYKYLFKQYNIESHLREHCIRHYCKTDNYQECLCMINHNVIHEHMNLALIDRHKNKDCCSPEDTLVILLDAFGTCTKRLATRITYGISCYKTEACGKQSNINCPACAFRNLRNDVLYNRFEQSVILCKGTGVLIDDKNPGYIGTDGHVYSKAYVKANETNDKFKNARPVYFV